MKLSEANYNEIRKKFTGLDLEEFDIISTPISDISKFRGSTKSINLGSVVSNYHQIRSITQKNVIAVVKARAYGAGLLAISNKLYEEGCRAYAVATLGAGIALQQGLPEDNSLILILGFIPAEALELALTDNLSVSITDFDVWPYYKKELEKLNNNKSFKPVNFHINVDTGMTRVGVPASLNNITKVKELAKDIQASPLANLQGIYTHFPLAGQLRSSGSYAENLTLEQIATVAKIVEHLKQLQIKPPYIHVANSPAVEQYPEAYNSWLTHVRTGSLLHGISLRNDKKFKRVIKWTTSLARVEKLERDIGVGYGHSYQGFKEQYIGTLTVGYADGYLNASGTFKNWVRIEGIMVPVVGSVAMDMCMIDLGPYVAAKGKAPEPYDALSIELMSDGTTNDILSMESLGRRWGVSWATVLAGIRTRNVSVYTQ